MERSAQGKVERSVELSPIFDAVEEVFRILHAYLNAHTQPPPTRTSLP